MNRIAQALVFALAAFAALMNGGCAQAHTVQTPSEFSGFSVAELDQMLAPVALYPDTVLSHVLIAATYPIEVVRAARWTRQNPGLRGEQAVNAVVGQDWDPSVMALVAFPEILSRMDADLDWTQRLGDAFLIQEVEVLDSIQRLRAQAYNAGHLHSTEQVQVIREREVIYIEPPRRQVVFVPVYDTRVVFGSWAWAHHPPLFWHAPPRHRSSVVVYWGPAFHVPSAFFFSSFHWSRREVVVIHHHHHYFRPHHPRSRTVVHHHHHHHHYRGRDLARHDAAQRWQHDPGHRRGVAYHPAVDERHRLLERRSDATAAAQLSAPVRVADTRTSQREWAAARRTENLLPRGGEGATRSTRSGTADSRSTAPARIGDSSRTVNTERSLRSPPGSTQRSVAAQAQRSPDRPALRSNQERSPARQSAGTVERRIQDRAAAQRAAGPAGRPAVSAPATTRSAQESRTSPRIERQSPATAARAPAATAPRSSIPPTSSRAMDSRASVPRATTPRPSSAPQVPANRAPATAPSQPRSVPQRAPARASSRGPESTPVRPPQAAPQRSSTPVQSRAPARSESRPPPDRRPARRVD